ncbi:hypothetical protein BDW59DRAFT_176687 [Aspergillus cavernicola]|uniref:SET domain-containing protein n=1 Tax=Aspergillus cavernicola TaxID=176166 RepID=A0ABR4HEL6_9EURO
MPSSLYDRIWRREAGGLSTSANIRALYGSKELVGDLDIVNELGGHTGCVNALSWSRSGRLLASGSDDFHMNIYSYQPDSSTAPFALNASIFTGHTGIIFSVAFMPHSNDRTLVTAAGDSQVRVFDIEHSTRTGSQGTPPGFATQSRRQLLNPHYGNVRFLDVENTNTRIYRSHADRVKRIVTESSPHLFLTCSEDGEVRQWDLRLPSSAYPKPRGGLLYMNQRFGQGHDDSNVPPPLISYKRHRLDLNTISCSPSQPHYIALGGAHPYAFLHDRRMLGRDLSAEGGDPGTSLRNGHDEELMGKATRCVRRFAPNSKQRSKSCHKGHITACKISNANPNEMIASWSGDHIYSFDLIRSPDALDAQEHRSSIQGKSSSRKRRSSMVRKRKRQNGPALSSSQSNGIRHISQRSQAAQEGQGELAFRVQYENGQTENIPFPSPLHGASADIMEQARYTALNAAQRHSLRIARSLVKLRKFLFSLDTSLRDEAWALAPSSVSAFRDSFSFALRNAFTFLPQMEKLMRTWRYPLNPSPEVVRIQGALRRNRESSYRFVQAAGTLAVALGGGLEDFGIDDDLERFQQIRPAPGEDNMIIRREQFGYDFLKAIVLFIEGGREALLSGFKSGPGHGRNRDRFPIPENSGDDALERVLIPYLQDLAGDTPVVNVDSSRFEHDATRILFRTQHAAVDAFAGVLRTVIPTEVERAELERTPWDSNPAHRATDPSSLTRFWLLEVGRGILMDAGMGVNFEYVNRAFGGLRTLVEDDPDDGMAAERSQDDPEMNVEEDVIRNLSLAVNRKFCRRHTEVSNISDDSDEDSEDDGGGDDDHDDSESDEAERLLKSYGIERHGREDVETDVPGSSYTRVYRGHCNVKTVKDANFFGLNDEYVVSGSDTGHLFIWERETCKLVNILKGDDEVVNVVQGEFYVSPALYGLTFPNTGHPYEPMIAASGIDDTIKIFSPDQRAQDDARQGINVLEPNSNFNGSGYISKLNSCKCMQDSYRIMSESDVQRHGGISDAFVTRNMLAQFTATLLRQQQGGLVEGENATRIVLDDNCSCLRAASFNMQDALQHRASVTSQLYADPHNPHLHLERGLVHERLGFPDLASADAYRALSLLDSVIDPDGCEFHARKRVAPESAPAPAEDEDEEDDEDEGYVPITEDEYHAMIGPVYALLVTSLVSCGCLRDAYEFALRGLDLEEMGPSTSASAKKVLEEQVALIKKAYYASINKDPQEGGEINPSTLQAQGYARRVLYPWNTHEPDRKSPETLNLLNERLKDVAPKCEVRAVALPVLHPSSSPTNPEDHIEKEEEISIQLGLFAKEDLLPGETILHESSLLTATNRLHDDLCDACNSPLPSLSSENPPVACAECADTIFCSQPCHDKAQEIYHAAVCGLMENLESIGKDIPDPKDKADYLYLLLLGRALAMAATQETHPLDLPEIKYIWGDFVPDNENSTNTNTNTHEHETETETGTLPFSFHLSILQPMRLIEEMQLDPYTTLPHHDTWVLNTLYAKFRGTASGRLSTWDGGPELCAVHPLWCLANHSCDPNVRWEWGGEIAFVVRGVGERVGWKRVGGGEEMDREIEGGGVKKDEEILNHYCDVGLDVKERREWAAGALGGKCLCRRCIWEAGEV